MLSGTQMLCGPYSVAAVYLLPRHQDLAPWSRTLRSSRGLDVDPGDLLLSLPGSCTCYGTGIPPLQPFGPRDGDSNPRLGPPKGVQKGHFGVSEGPD